MLAVFGWIMWGLLNLIVTFGSLFGSFVSFAFSGIMRGEIYLLLVVFILALVSWYFFFVNSPFMIVGG